MIAYDRVKKGGMLRNSGSSFNFDELYPVGSLYTTIDDTFDPNSAPGWQGTWVKISGNYYFKTIDPNDPEESIGSYYSTTKNITTSSHQLTVAEMPVHKHDTGDMSMDAAGSHNHVALSTTAANDANSCHLHAVKASSGPWLADNIPAVSYRKPIYSNTTDQDKIYTNYTWTRGELAQGGYGTNDAIYYSGAHTHNITTTTEANGSHIHELAGHTGEEGYGQGHTHDLTLTNIKPNYVAIIVWKRTA